MHSFLLHAPDSGGQVTVETFPQGHGTSRFRPAS